MAKMIELDEIADESPGTQLANRTKMTEHRLQSSITNRQLAATDWSSFLGFKKVTRYLEQKNIIQGDERHLHRGKECCTDFQEDIGS